MKWYTETEYVDVETGEMLTKEAAVKDYIIKTTIKTVKIDGNNGKIKYQRQCERSRQCRLF